MPRYMPDFPEFRRLVDEARSRGIDAPLVPVYRELVADGLTPVSAYARIGKGGRPSFLFESVIGGEKVGRFSFLGAGPFCRFEARRENVSIHHQGDAEAVRMRSGDPFRELQGLLKWFPSVHLPSLPRFCGG